MKEDNMILMQGKGVSQGGAKGTLGFYQRRDASVERAAAGSLAEKCREETGKRVE